MLCLHCKDDFTSDEIQTSFLDIDNFPAFLSCVTNQVIVSAPVQSGRNEAFPLVVATRTLKNRLSNRQSKFLDFLCIVKIDD